MDTEMNKEIGDSYADRSIRYVEVIKDKIMAYVYIQSDRDRRG